MGIHKPVFSVWIGDEEIAEVKALNPQITNSELQKMADAVESKITNAMGVPYKLFGGDTNCTNTTAESALAMPSMDQLAAKMRWLTKEFAGAWEVESRLPKWIIEGRFAVARKLWLAGEVFQHNMMVLGKYHGLC